MNAASGDSNTARRRWVVARQAPVVGGVEWIERRRGRRSERDDDAYQSGV